MNTFRFIKNSVLFYWRSLLGIVLGVAVASTVLTGALIVGDCVHYTLRSIALQRLGNIEYALTHPSRFFRDDLAADLEETLSATVAPVYQANGMMSSTSSGNRANQVAVYGVTDSFWQLSSSESASNPLEPNTVAINQQLADVLEVQEGDSVVLRVENPSSISREVLMTTTDDSSFALRVTVSKIVSAEQLGHFNLRANQTHPKNAFVSLGFLQEQTERSNQANTLLIEQLQGETLSTIELNSMLQQHWKLEDIQLTQLDVPETDLSEIRTERIFLESPIQNGIESALSGRPSFGVLTYFANQFQHENQSTPYSMVASLEASEHSVKHYPALEGLQDDEVIINQWLADDLQLEEGESLTIIYYDLGPMRELHERAQTFQVKTIVDMSNPLCDRTLMPDFPGIAEIEHSRDWDPGFDIDLELIRDKDEAYWDEYRGTPKAFVNLSIGQELWKNRWGKLTAIRYKKPNEENTDLSSTIASTIPPNAAGLMFQPVRSMALQAVDQAMNFSPLFIGLSFFLIVAALILTSLVFLFRLEQRSREMGILLSLGYTKSQLKFMYLFEGVVLCAIGSLVGALLAIAYAQGMIWALTTVWSGAVAHIPFQVHILPTTLAAGFISSMVIALLTLWFGIRKLLRGSVLQLLSNKVAQESNEIQTAKSPMNWIFWLSCIFVLMGAILFFAVPAKDAASMAGKFFGIGACLLLAGIGFSRSWLVWMLRPSSETHITWVNLGMRNNTRRRSRSLAVIGLLACGSFLVIAVGANRHEISYNADNPSSGTGGYAYWGETTLPIYYNLNTEKGLNQFGLSRSELSELEVVHFRLRQGDEASCLNLNRAQTPQVLGVDPEPFAQRNAFSFISVKDGASTESEEAWKLLNQKVDDNVIPAFADQATILWALGKSIGDTLTYQDGQGNTFKIQFVGMLSNSIFQGHILIAEDFFVERFSSVSGYKIHLFDMPADKEKDYRNLLTFALQDYGLELNPADERLAAFYEVENTYLSIFQILGGLGLILGCIGLGIIVMRNLMERRAEIALFKALGFEQKTILNMVLTEHAFLVVLGVGCGLVAGLLAALPAILTKSDAFPYFTLTITILIMLANAGLWIFVSTLIALRENTIAALRSE